MTTSDAGLAFGFVQRGVVADLQDVGNWKSRATAIDALHKQLRDVHSPSVLLHGLGDFVKFLVGLIADPNFKIAISSMSILGDLAGKVGNELEAHLRTIMPPLLEKFSDSKILVRAANMKVLRRLMGAVSPAAVLGLLGAGAAHSSWRVREEVLNAHIMAVLSFSRPSYDALAVYRLLSSCLGDTSPRVRVVAQEALAALHSRLAPGELAAWAAGQRGAGHALPEQQRQQVLARLGDKSLPCINGEGMVDHVVELPQGAAGAGSMGGAAVGEAGDLRLVDAAALGGGGGGGGGAGRHPWDAGAAAGPIATANTPARPRARPAGPLDMASGHSFVGARPLLGLGPLNVDGPAGGGGGGWGGPLTPGGGTGVGPAAAGRVAGAPLNEVVGGRHGHGLGPGHGEEGGLWSPAHRPVALLGAYAHPPSRLGSHDSGGGGGSGGGAPASAGWGGGGVVHARSGSPTGAPGAGHHGHGYGYGYGHPDSALPPERHSTGGTAAERHSGGGLLQPLKHLWGGLRGLDSSDDSPLSPTRGYQSVIGSSRNSFSTQAPGRISDSAAAAGVAAHGPGREGTARDALLEALAPLSPRSPRPTVPPMAAGRTSSRLSQQLPFNPVPHATHDTQGQGQRDQRDGDGTALLKEAPSGGATDSVPGAAGPRASSRTQAVRSNSRLSQRQLPDPTPFHQQQQQHLSDTEADGEGEDSGSEGNDLRDACAPPHHSFSHPPVQRPRLQLQLQPSAGLALPLLPASPRPPLGPPGHLQHAGSGAVPDRVAELACAGSRSLNSPPVSARQETFSPSKAEMLARLKHRQIEKRVATAQMESSTASAGELILSHSDITGASSSFPAPSQHARRGLFSQLSDNARGERQHSGDFSGGPPAARGFHSVISTPTRPSGLGSCDDTPVGTPGSARPPRAGLGSRRAPLAVDTGAAGAMSRPSYTSSPASHGAHGSPAASEESPARNASPALGRYRARSADPQAAGLLGSGGPGAGPGSGGGTVPPTPSQAAAMGGSLWDKGGAMDDLGPLPDPERSIKTVIAKLVEANHADRKELDWQGQFDALVDGRRLARNHGDVLRAGAGAGASLHDFVRAATPAIDALRSTTAKGALGLFQDLFCYLGRVMDRELDEVVPVLLKKAGEVSNAGRDNFLAAEADRVLADMCRVCGEARVLAALLGCAGHKNPYVRGKVAFHVDNHLEALAGGGAGRQALLNNWTCLERAFKAAAAFLDEGSLETRTYGKRVIWHLKVMVASPSDFQRLMASVAPAALQRKVTDVIEGTNGPPPPPSRAAAGSVGRGGASRMGAPPSPARMRMDQGPGSLTAPPPPVRAGSFSAPAPLHGAPTPERRRAGGRQQSGGPDLDGIPESVGSSRGNSSAGGYANGNGASAGGGRGLTRRNSGLLGRAGSGGLGSGGGHANGGGSGGGGGGYAAAFSPATQEVVVKALQLLGAKDFRERVEALRSVEGVAGALAGAPDSLVIQLLDAVVERLGDANVKVSMQALDLVSTLAGSLRGRLSLGLNTMVPALAAALGSTSDKVRSVAIAATDALINTLEPAMLIQHFSHCVSNGNIQRGKPLLVEKLVAIVHSLYGSKPQLVVRYAVPAAFALLNDGRGEGKAAANALLTALARCMGTALIDQAATLNTVAQQRVADAVSAAMGHR